MTKILQLANDAVKLRFIPFALKDLAKKWLYSLAENSIITWDDFKKVFLKSSTLSTKLPLLEKI